MNQAILHPNLKYCDMGLDRNSELRQNGDWLKAQLASDTAKVVTLFNQENLVRRVDNSFEPVYLPISDAALILGNSVEVIYLGHDNQLDAPIFAADMTGQTDTRVLEIINHAAPECELMDLRHMGPILPSHDASVFAYARGTAYWHQQNGFCARCGHETHSFRGGHMRKCEACDKEIFPRIDPAVIMLVELEAPTDGAARCLLGRHAKFPHKVYSTLAGFVDLGETLEQTVVREVMEEAGVRAENPKYIASQPWPFPASMMLGFRATTKDTEINFATDELEDARWFTREEVRQFGEYGSESEFALPRVDSISRMLIETWLAHEIEI